ncbi:crotonobetaine/carnitine-CoA ligase [Actinomycetospora succinea]|uniref:Crotonobetaine/carnitine-CoA ligase n=1 Tax=Actinomycetospora succinea TaxID=663603 RepID=A0A4R6ULI3_9PSEU|nr:AMP-binding protein [Actinomycetospora succinea]TDQ47036.1 crotonobetaine/carnitine-CoA ligase [Actinomycetospora succinea]
MSSSVFDVLAGTAADRPDAPFLVFAGDTGTETVSYGEQVRRADATAGLLADLGVGTGARVHLMTPNRPEFLDVWFACARLGAVVVPVNPLSTADEVAHQLTDSRAVLSVVDDALRGTIVGERAVITLDELVARRADAPPPPAAAHEDLAAIMFTSGTTSAPKGVQVTHANYLRVGRLVADHLRVTAADRWLVTLPLFHGNAQYYCLMSALVAGGSVAVAARFSATGWPTQARELRPTLASLFAAPVRMVLARSTPAPTDADNDLRLVLFAQNLAPAQAQEFETRFGAPLIQLYGMTETVVPPFMNPLDDRRRWDSIGLPLPGIEVRVVGEEGEPGELQVRGRPGIDVTPGYDGRPEATAALFDDGWLRTGDQVRLDAEGRAYFVDRAKDMMKRAGENVAASEVEQVLAAHPAVLESAVHGVPDPVYDEAIVAHVVLAPGAHADPDELVAWCAERLSRFKVPGTVVLRDELPRSTIGKILKNALRDEVLEASR